MNHEVLPVMFSARIGFDCRCHDPPADTGGAGGGPVGAGGALGEVAVWTGKVVVWRDVLELVLCELAERAPKNGLVGASMADNGSARGERDEIRPCRGSSFLVSRDKCSRERDGGDRADLVG